eukprot:327347-Chlamydomonas_euryale.AAC.4
MPQPHPSTRSPSSQKSGPPSLPQALDVGRFEAPSWAVAAARLVGARSVWNAAARVRTATGRQRV